MTVHMEYTQSNHTCFRGRPDEGVFLYVSYAKRCIVSDSSFSVSKSTRRLLFWLTYNLQEQLMFQSFPALPMDTGIFK